MMQPHKSECPAATGQDAVNRTTNDLNFATGQRPSKAIATQIAELALAGHTVHKLQCGDFLVSKWGYIHHANDFEALQAFAKKLGVSK